MNLFRFLICYTLIFIIISCKQKTLNVQPTPTPQSVVDVMIANKQIIDNTIELNGTVVANNFAELHPEISGRLTFLNIPEGTVVQKGTLIAKINDADLEAQLNKTKVLLSLAITTERRDKNLLQDNGINQADYDAALNAVNGYKADMAYTQSLIDKTVVKAPFTGTIGLRQISLGAYVTPATLIANIQQLDELKLDFNVPESYSNLIRKGNTITVLLGTENTKLKKAIITAIEPEVNTITRNLKVRALLENNTKASPGVYAKVYVKANDDNKGILIPTNCLIANDRKNQVIVVKNGKAKFIDVETGFRQSNLVEITKGISIGDSVVVTGVLLARPNSVVSIKSVKQFNEVNQ